MKINVEIAQKTEQVYDLLEAPEGWYLWSGGGGTYKNLLGYVRRNLDGKNLVVWFHTKESSGSELGIGLNVSMGKGYYLGTRAPQGTKLTLEI